MSKAPTKSENTASASCRPARTEMISELGFVYRLFRTESKKTVKVLLVSRSGRIGAHEEAYIKSYLIRGFNSIADAHDSSDEKLLRMRLEM